MINKRVYNDIVTILHTYRNSGISALIDPCREWSPAMSGHGINVQEHVNVKYTLAMYSLAAASRHRLSATEPKWFVSKNSAMLSVG